MRKLSLILLLMFLLAMLQPAAAGASLATVNVSVYPLTPGAASQFTIGFYVSGSGRLDGGDDIIEIEFPEGVLIPSSIAGGEILINGYSLGSSYIDVGGEILTLELPPAVDIPAYGYVNIIIPQTAGIRLPSRGGTYRLVVSTSNDGAASSNPFTIEGSSISNLLVSVSPTTADERAEYEISFKTGAKGALVGGEDTIYLEFPDKIVLPRSISRNYIQVNGEHPSTRGITVERASNTVAVEVPDGLNIGNGAAVTVKISADADIYNPEETGDYDLGVYTSKDAQIVRAEYTIGLSISAPVVVVSPAEGGATSQYSIGFTTSSKGALTGGNDFIYLYFPAGTYIPNTINTSHVTVNGYPARYVSYSASENRIAIQIPSSVDIPGNSYVGVVIRSTAGVKNPNAGGQYRLEVSTTADTGRTKSREYLISGNTSSMGRATVVLTTTGASAYSGMTIEFEPGANGALRGTSDRIMIVFPEGFALPASINRTDITVNDIIAGGTEINGNILTITPLQNLDAGQRVRIVIKSSAMIRNPAVEGSYTLKTYTTQEPAIVDSENFSIGSSGAVVSSPIIFKIGSKQVYNGPILMNIDTAPTIIDDHTVVPLRALGDVLGAETSYDPNNQSVTVNYNNRVLVFYINSKLVKVGNEWVMAQIPATLVNDRVMIPVRFVSQSYGATVDWNPETQEVIITK